jgi:hypothetical protein
MAMLHTSSKKHLVLNKFYLTSVLLFSLVLSIVQSPLSFGANPPSAPQYVEPMSDTNQVAITWDPPSSNGGEPLLNYTARIWSLPPPTNSAIFASCTTTQFGCIIGGLIAGNVYYVDVIASNSAGAGAPSASRSISPGASGKPPSNVSATSDAQGLITVKWVPLTSAGTGTFAWYRAEIFTDSEIGTGSYTSYCTTGAITDSSCLIGGLKLGTTYYAQVRTYTSLGSGFPSFPRIKIIAGTPAAPTASPTPSQTAPSASTSSKATPKATSSIGSQASPGVTGLASSSTPPRNVKVISLSKALRFSWSPPKNTGGLKILGYRADALGGSDKLLHECRTTAKVFTCTIKNLESKQVYNVAVYTMFAGKESPSSKIFRVVTKS